MKSLLSVTDDMGNPFTDESGDLLVLDTKDLADASVFTTVEEIETLGQEQLETFVKERLSEENQRTCMILLRRISFHFSEVVVRKSHPMASSKSSL